jgi:hypothetical protein
MKSCKNLRLKPNKLILRSYGYFLYFFRFGALEEVFMSYRPHGAWRTMEVLEELA